MDNLAIYNDLRVVPEEAKKKITGGRLNGFTDINSMWRIKRLTEKFGPCGIGWKTINEKYRTEPGADGAVAAFCELDLVYRLDGGGWSEPIHGDGGSMLVAKEKGGLYTDDECFKKARTDAIGNAGKLLGLGADVYNENDRTKYKKELYKCSKCGKSLHDVMLRNGELWAAHDIAIYGLRRFGDMLCDECQNIVLKEEKEKKEESLSLVGGEIVERTV